MVSIIILSYNTQELLRSCLSSLQHNLTSVDYEIIVVDNASQDDSVLMIKKEFPKIILIENEKNVGFAKGVNIGAKRAKGNYLLFLNSDTEVTQDTIGNMVDEFNTQEKIGVIGGMLLNSNGTYQRSFGNFYTLFHVLVMLIGGDKGEKLASKIIKSEVDWVSGGFMMIPKELFEALHGFDEKFFMYVEDMELCYRVKKKHHRVIILPNVKVLHVGHGSSNRTFAIVHIYKGILYFYQKHRSQVSYTIVRYLLQLKAYIAIFIGKLTKNTYLVNTYTQALAII